jgi:hypothetical protein
VQALSLEPSNSAIEVELRAVEQRLEAARRRQQQAYKSMFDSKQDSGETAQDKEEKQTPDGEHEQPQQQQSAAAAEATSVSPMRIQQRRVSAVALAPLHRSSLCPLCRTQAPVWREPPQQQEEQPALRSPSPAAEAGDAGDSGAPAAPFAAPLTPQELAACEARLQQQLTGPTVPPFWVSPQPQLTSPFCPL